MLWFECEMTPRGSHIWTLGPQLVVFFEKAGEPLGHRALLEEVSHWGQTLRIYSPALLPVYSRLPECSSNVTSQPPAPDTVPSLAAVHLLLNGALYHLELQVKIISFSLHLLLSGLIITGMRKSLRHCISKKYSQNNCLSWKKKWNWIFTSKQI